jgi:arsenate reductase
MPFATLPCGAWGFPAREGAVGTGARKVRLGFAFFRSSSSKTGHFCRDGIDPSGQPEDSMTITMYGIKNCDTVTKARSWLDKYGIAYAFFDYKLASLGADRLAIWCEEFGWENVLNRGGTTFRKLPETERQHLDAGKAMSLMLTQPSMIKRPILDLGDRRLIGFKPELYRAALT